MDQLPEVNARLPDEPDDHFYYKHAGRAVLICTLESSFYGIHQGLLPQAGLPSSIDQSMGSLLYAHAVLQHVMMQDGHTGKKPEDTVEALPGSPVSQQPEIEAQIFGPFLTLQTKSRKF